MKMEALATCKECSVCVCVCVCKMYIAILFLSTEVEFKLFIRLSVLINDILDIKLPN
jgi:hypothetical protein